MTARGLAGLAAAALLGACSSAGGAQAPDDPEGYTRHQADEHSFLYADGWERQPDEESGVVEFLGPEGTGDIRTGVRAQRGPGLPDDAPMDVYVHQFHLNADLQLRDREVMSEDPVEVAGARDAMLVESRYVVPLEGDEVPMRQFDLLVLTDDGASVNLRAAGPADDVGEDVLRTIVDSLRLRA